MDFTVINITEIAGLIVGSGLISSFLTWIFNKKKSKAEIKKISQETESGQIQSASMIMTMAQNLLRDISAEREALQGENKLLEASAKALTEQVNRFQDEVDSLKEQVEALQFENAALKKTVKDVQNENQMLRIEVAKLKIA